MNDPEVHSVFHAPKRRWLRYSPLVLLLLSISVLAFLVGARHLLLVSAQHLLDDELVDDDTITPVDTIFRATVGEPFSVTAADVQGGGHTWQGYSVYLRFLPSKKFAETLLQKGYKEVPFDHVGPWLEVEPRIRERFSPPWCPGCVKHPKCFSITVANRWSSSGDYYILIDQDTGIVYVHGLGT